jgi:hypothetical protein
VKDSLGRRITAPEGDSEIVEGQVKIFSMERDFLGAIGKESRAASMEDGRSNLQNSGTCFLI